jgi:hypothetical protein
VWVSFSEDIVGLGALMPSCLWYVAMSLQPSCSPWQPRLSAASQAVHTRKRMLDFDYIVRWHLKACIHCIPCHFLQDIG